MSRISRDTSTGKVHLRKSLCNGGIFCPALLSSSPCVQLLRVGHDFPCSCSNNLEAPIGKPTLINSASS